MSGLVNYYATKSDLLKSIESIEKVRDLSYFFNSLSDSPGIHVYHSAKELPDIGISTTGGESEQYIITGKEIEIKIRSIPQRRGGILYSYDYNLVPCISFRSSGEYEGKCIIYGMFGVGDNADDYAKELFKEFKKHFLKGYKKKKSFWVGPKALLKAAEGVRLTPNSNAHTIMDLKL